MADDGSSDYISPREDKKSRGKMHKLFPAIFAAQIGFLGVIYNSSKESSSLLDAKYKAVVAFYVVLLIYALLRVVEITTPRTLRPLHGLIIMNLSLFFGALTSALLLYMAIPVFGILVLIPLTVWFLIMAYKLGVEFYHSMANAAEEPSHRPPV